MKPVTGRKARVAVRTLFVLAWLLGAGAALLARDGESALAWFVGITAVVLLAGAVGVAASAAEAELELEHTEVVVRSRTVTRDTTREVIDVAPVRDEDEEIRP